MKKFLPIIVLAIFSYAQLHAQSTMAQVIATTSYDLETLQEKIESRDTIAFYIDSLPTDHDFCLANAPVVLVYAQPNCDEFLWSISGQGTWDNPVVICPPQQDLQFTVTYNSGENCGNLQHTFRIKYKSNTLPSSTEEWLWQEEGTSFDLALVGNDSVGPGLGYSFQWEGGPSANGYHPNVPGDYVGYVNHACGTTPRIKHCRWYPKLRSASYDPTSEDGLAVNVTWETNEHISPYVGEMHLLRDGHPIAAIDYQNDTIYVDNVQLAAVREYQLQITDVSGTVCPEMYTAVQTLFVMHVLGIDGVYMSWNQLLGYGTIENFFVGEYVPSKDGEVHIIDTLGANATSTLCPYSMFDNGAYGLILAKTAGRAEPILIQSNRTREKTDGLSENNNPKLLSVYPNPTTGQFTIEYVGKITIMNTLGQEILSQNINGPTTFVLPTGEYIISTRQGKKTLLVR